MDLLNRYVNYGKDLSDVEDYCFKKILEMEISSNDLTIQDLALTLSVSTSTIYRMAKKLGYNSYKELRYAILFSKRKEYDKSGYSSNIALKMNEQFNNTLVYLKELEIEKIIKLIVDSEYITVASTGLNNQIAKIMSIKLGLLGKRVGFSDDQWICFLDASKLRKNDLLIAFSRSGETKEILNTIKNAKINGGKVILFTTNPRTEMASLADFSIISESEINEGYDLDSRLQMHVCVNFILKNLIYYMEENKIKLL